MSVWSLVVSERLGEEALFKYSACNRTLKTICHVGEIDVQVLEIPFSTFISYLINEGDLKSVVVHIRSATVSRSFFVLYESWNLVVSIGFRTKGKCHRVSYY